MIEFWMRFGTESKFWYFGKLRVLGIEWEVSWMLGLTGLQSLVFRQYLIFKSLRSWVSGITCMQSQVLYPTQILIDLGLGSWVSPNNRVFGPGSQISQRALDLGSDWNFKDLRPRSYISSKHRFLGLGSWFSPTVLGLCY